MAEARLQPEARLGPVVMTALDVDRIAGHMREAVDLALAEVERGGIPFAGVVLHPTAGVLGTGVNRVLVERDPTAHAEVVALRAAAKTDPALVAESVLLASGEPCGMCYRAAFDHGVTTVYYAVSADEAARYGFDYRASYRDLDRRGRTIEPCPVDGSLDPFTAWARRAG
ncbi:nucleoside deaminase [Actinosynnema sp. NPDC059335]|uniref:nucleoside deaminase n=1 Tax=Actinosynnema sp. NPDC059335 TaxID=3346804 RepID=UPI00366E4632